jgi:type II secretory pathway pseudopilin PulG
MSAASEIMPTNSVSIGARQALSGLHGNRGAALLTVLVMVVLLGLTASLAGQSLGALLQREREAELLFRGLQYRQAIASYYQGKKMYPTNLEDLLRDPRFPGIVRHLRRLYNDPMTGQEWELVKDASQKLIGVRSTSDLTPFQQVGFPAGLEALEGKSTYREWEFVYVPAKKAGDSGATPAAPGKGHPASGSSIEVPSPDPKTPGSTP